jgi:hypothetical protein
VISTVLLALATPALSFAAQDVPAPSRPAGTVKHSPYPEQSFPNRVYFGDTHLHTAYSADAGMAGAIVGREDAYRVARGETVKSNSGLPVRLERPLDFLVVADHAGNLGLAPMIAESSPELLKSEWGEKVHDLVKGGKGPDAFNMWLAAMQELKVFRARFPGQWDEGNHAGTLTARSSRRTAAGGRCPWRSISQFSL